MTKTFISVRQKKLYVTHLLSIKWSIKQFNMCRNLLQTSFLDCTSNKWDK